MLIHINRYLIKQIGKDEPLSSASTPSLTIVQTPLNVDANQEIPAKKIRKEEPLLSASTSSLVETGSGNRAAKTEASINAEGGFQARKVKHGPTTPCGKIFSRKKLINKIENLTPTAKRIYREYLSARNQANFHIRAKRALKFSKDKAFEKLTLSMNPYAKKFISMQIKLCKKRAKGRRFTLDEKLIALSIMKQSPKCYRFLHRIFILPSKSTLNEMVSKLNIEAGINPRLFNLMKKEVNTWNDHKKYCSIIFDEMALSMGLSYDSKKDNINGFVELNDRKCRFADHVLVFMVRGAIYKWQQPFCYYFCEGATSGPELKKIIKDVAEAVAETGLKPIAISCDQGTAFQSAIKSFQEDTRRNQLLQDEQPSHGIMIGVNKLYIIFDPSHLIKGMRNNLLNKNIKSKGKISQWKDIVDVYKTDCKHTESRLLHKLNDEHVIPEK